MTTLDTILVKMREENPPPESKLFPGRPPLTNVEKQARHQLKKRILAAVESPGGGGRQGGVDRISEIVVKQARQGLRTGALQVTVRDGLLAEKLIDSREGKIDDRKALVTLAFALTGGQLQPPPEMLLLDDGLTIDGDFEELEG